MVSTFCIRFKKSLRAPQKHFQGSKVSSGDWPGQVKSCALDSSRPLPGHSCDLGGSRLMLVYVWTHGIPVSLLDFRQHLQWFDHLQGAGHSGHPLTVQPREWRCHVTQKMQWVVWRRGKEPGDQAPECEVPASTTGKSRAGPWEPRELPGDSSGLQRQRPSLPLCQAAAGSLRLGRALARILEIWAPVSLLDLGKSLTYLGQS